MRGAVWRGLGALALGACTPEVGGGPPWTPPTWEGDGLPSDTPLGGSQDGRGDGDSGGGGREDTGEGEGGSPLDGLYLVDGVFGVDVGAQGSTGYLVLSTEPVTCAEMMTYADFPYGVYLLLEGPPGATLTGGWEGHYGWCGEAPAPCMRDGFWLSQGASGELGEADQVVVQAAGAHALTVARSFGQNKEEILDIDNCQDMDAW